MKRAVVVLALLSAPVLATALRPFAGMRGDASLGWNSANGSPSGAAAPPSPNFDLVAGSTTPNDLSDSLTVNSTSMTLVLACDAQGISGTNWTCRNSSGAVTLSEAGTGSSPTTTISTPFHALDAVERQTTYGTTQKRHDAASSTIGDLATDDFVVEYVGKLSASSGAVVIDKGLAGTDGWRLSQSTTAAMQLQLRTASVTASVIGATGQTSSWTHFIAFIDRSEASTNGAVAYGNGAAGSGVDFSGRSASATNASTLAVGAASAGSSNAATVSSIRVWRCSGCMAGGASNPTQWASIARQRTVTAFGIAPSLAVGLSAPTTMARATTGHIDVVDGGTRQLYLAGNNAPRVARRTYSGGTALAGYMNEPAVSNIALQSQTLEATWTALTVGDTVLVDAWAGADLTTTGDDVDGANSLGEHGLRQSITLTAATHTFSAWAKAGAQTFAVLRDNTVVNGAAWFDIATCTSASCTIGEDCTSAVKTVQAGVIQGRAQRWPVDTTGDGVADVSLCRISISYTGTAAPNDHDLLCAPSDGVLTYTDADATADCGFWGVRVEAFPIMTSYLATTAAPTARNADDVRFDGASHYTGSPTTMDVQVLCPPHDTDTSRIFASVGTTGTNYAGLRVASTDFAEALGVVSSVQWQITAASGDVSDGVAHNLRQTMATNSIQAYYDGLSIGTDTLATLPTEVSSFVYLGTQGGTTAQTGCLLSRVRLWPALVAP
jgi:hypothetical protein